MVLNDVETISLEDIQIGYRDSNPIISNFSMKFKKGNLLLILSLLILLSISAVSAVDGNVTSSSDDLNVDTEINKKLDLIQ